MGDSIVLEEEIDPNYEPTEEEILEYAKWLGMDLENDKDLFWVAKQGLKVENFFSYMHFYGKYSSQFRHPYQRIGNRAKQLILEKFTTSTLPLVLVLGIIHVMRSE